MVSINSLDFDRSLVEGWYKGDNTDRGQGWMDNRNPENMSRVFMLDYFPENAPLPGHEVLNNLELIWRDRIPKSNREGLCLLDLGAVTCKSSLQFIRTIEKKPMQPHGMAYQGTLTLVDLAFFRLTMWFFERGVTGMRDAVLMDQFMAGGTFDPELEDWGGWWVDPHGFGKQTPLMQNWGEDERFDAQFPEHPLSQLRSYLRKLEESLSFDPDKQWVSSQSGKGKWFGKLFGKN